MGLGDASYADHAAVNAFKDVTVEKMIGPSSKLQIVFRMKALPSLRENILSIDFTVWKTLGMKNKELNLGRTVQLFIMNEEIYGQGSAKAPE